MRTNYPLHDGYVWEKLHSGLTTLADTEGKLSERLAQAYDAQLRLLDTDDIDDLRIPPALSREILGILGRLRRSFVNRGDYAFDLEGIGELELKELVSGLILVYGKLCRLLPEDHVAVAPRDPNEEE